MLARNIFSVRLLARQHPTPGPGLFEVQSPGGLTLSGAPGWVRVVGGQGALQGEEQKEDHEGKPNLRFQSVFD